MAQRGVTTYLGATVLYILSMMYPFQVHMKYTCDFWYDVSNDMMSFTYSWKVENQKHAL